jgi:hypothetical protein
LRKLDILRWVAARAAGYKDYQIESGFSIERKEFTRIDYRKAADAWESLHPNGKERMRREIEGRLRD